LERCQQNRGRDQDSGKLYHSPEGLCEKDFEAEIHDLAESAASCLAVPAGRWPSADQLL